MKKKELVLLSGTEAWPGAGPWCQPQEDGRDAGSSPGPGVLLAPRLRRGRRSAWGEDASLCEGKIYRCPSAATRHNLIVKHRPSEERSLGSAMRGLHEGRVGNPAVSPGGDGRPA